MLQAIESLFESRRREIKLAALGLLGVVIGMLCVRLLVTCFRDAPKPETAVNHHQQLNAIVTGHLGWAEDAADAGIAPHVQAVQAFFDEARGGTRGFAEDVLDWKSKWLLAKDYLSDGSEHTAFIDERFACHIFQAEQLERLLESCFASYLRYLSDIDSQLLVRLQADLEGLPSADLPESVDRETIRQRLDQAIHDAVESVQADFRGVAKRELVSFLSGEVLAMATARLATSAGIVGIGAGSGTLTFGAGLVVGIIVDWIISWAYDALYDPVGEISSRLDNTLLELRDAILNGDGSAGGLPGRLQEFAAERAAARNGAIRAVVLP